MQQSVKYVVFRGLDIKIQENIKQNLLALIVKQVGQNTENHLTGWQSFCLKVISWPFHPLRSVHHLFVPLHKQSGFKQAAMADAYFWARCLASRFMKQQVTVAMMTMPTNKAEETPITKGMRRRSATGERQKKKEGCCDVNSPTNRKIQHDGLKLKFHGRLFFSCDITHFQMREFPIHIQIYTYITEFS